MIRSKKLSTKPKAKKCAVRGCKNEFMPRNSTDKVCSGSCALVLVRKAAKVKEAKRAKEQRKQTRAEKEAIKTKPQLTREAQDAFNEFIRLRDADLPCICCGSYGPDEDWLTGGKWDAGHFKSRGGFPELRFVEDNCHKQLKSCNGGSSKYARKGRVVSENYRPRLVEKIGIERVEWLEGPHESPNYTHDDLRNIRDQYRAKARELRKQREST